MVGSFRRDSINRRLADAVTRIARESLTFRDVRIDELLLYNQDDADPTESVKTLRAAIRQASGVLFVTPEYNRSIPGMLKNALDHASRPYGQSAWACKPVGILGVSPGTVGTATAQQHLRNVLAYLDMPTLGQPEAFIQKRSRMTACHPNRFFGSL